MAAAERVPGIDRQLQQLLNASSSARNLHLTNVLRALADEAFIDASIPSSSRYGANESFQKLLLRIKSSLERGRDVKETLEIVCELAVAVPWNSIAHAAEVWIRACLTHFAEEPRQCIRLLDILTGHDARARPEFYRNVGGPAATKYALLLVEATRQDSFAHARDADVILSALSNQVALQPSTFRQHAARLHEVCMCLLFQRRRCVTQATALLAALPMTGKGRDGELVLWSATADALIAEAELAWQGCSNAYVDYGVDEAAKRTSLFARTTDKEEEDSVSHVRTSHERLAFIFGCAPSAGVLPLFLAEATTYRIPLQIARLQHLLHSILSLFPSSPSQSRSVPEATLHATQAALLSKAHLCAFSCLATLPAEALSRGGHAKTIRLILAHTKRGSPTIRCAAMQTLASLQMPLDPHNVLLTRCVRACLSQLAKLVNRTDEVAIEASATTANGGGSTRAKKKRKVFESDHVVYRPLEGFAELDEDENACCQAAVRWIGDPLFGGLLTFLTSDMQDLAQTSALMISGLLEISLKKPDGLTVCLTQTLAKMIFHSRGLILGLLAVRTPLLCAQASISTNNAVREAAWTLGCALSDSFLPKLPPKLALRLHMESDQIRLDNAANDNEDPVERVLEDPAIDERRGLSEIEALQAVLDVSEAPSSHLGDASTPIAVTPAKALPLEVTHPLSTKSPTQFVQSTYPTSNGVNTDPIKPVRRPSTPNIGSPGTLTPLGSAAKRRISLSPERTNVALDAGPTLQSASGQDGTLSSRAQSPTSSMVQSPLSKTTASAHQLLLLDDDDDDGDDSDGSMPQLDVRSSDEESEAG